MILLNFLSTIIAHAGDGNFHTVILFDPQNEEQRKEAENLNHFMVHTALSLEGTKVVTLENSSFQMFDDIEFSVSWDSKY